MLDCLTNSLLLRVVGTWLIVSGVVGFFSMGIDKDRAIHGEWRVREKTLFIIALAGGSFGMVLGSELFHHKTSKLSFLLILYGVVAAWLFALQSVGFLSCLIIAIPNG